MPRADPCRTTEPERLAIAAPAEVELLNGRAHGVAPPQRTAGRRTRRYQAPARDLPAASHRRTSSGARWYSRCPDNRTFIGRIQPLRDRRELSARKYRRRSRALPLASVACGSSSSRSSSPCSSCCSWRDGGGTTASRLSTGVTAIPAGGSPAPVACTPRASPPPRPARTARIGPTSHTASRPNGSTPAPTTPAPTKALPPRPRS